MSRELRPYHFGLKVWIDEGELNIGDSLIWKISEAVRDSDFVLVVLSQSSVESAWVKLELEIAMTQQLSQNRFKILPVVKDKCEIPAFLSGKVYSDFSKKGNRKENIRRLVSSILPSKAFSEMIKEVAENEGMSVKMNQVLTKPSI